MYSSGNLASSNASSVVAPRSTAASSILAPTINQAPMAVASAAAYSTSIPTTSMATSSSSIHRMSQINVGRNYSSNQGDTKRLRHWETSTQASNSPAAMVANNPSGPRSSIMASFSTFVAGLTKMMSRINLKSGNQDNAPISRPIAKNELTVTPGPPILPIHVARTPTSTLQSSIPNTTETSPSINDANTNENKQSTISRFTR